MKLSSVGSVAGSTGTAGYMSGAESSIGTIPTPPTSGNMVLNLPTLDSKGEGGGKGADIDHREQILVLGIDISHLSRKKQFIYCAGGVFFFFVALWVPPGTH